MAAINKALKDNIRSAGIIKTNFYNYFHIVFSAPPQEDFIGSTSILLPYFEELKKHILSNDYSSALRILKQYKQYEDKTEDKDDVIDFLQDIFNELFITEAYRIPASASEYMPSAKIKSTENEKVRDIYEINAFNTPENNLPADHISSEMSYMQQLNALLVKVCDENDDEKIGNILQEQFNFLQAHIITWIDEFVTFLKEQISNPEANPYYAFAVIMDEFIKYDRNLTEEFLQLFKNSE
ncbi:MAG: molecular chaperone TorD family protein [Mucispirillum sp.]|nr:molecular chaperone TorD family protein [Mucispirillum sp.]